MEGGTHARSVFSKEEQNKVSKELTQLKPFKESSRDRFNYCFDVFGLWDDVNKSNYRELVTDIKKRYKSYRSP